MRYLSLRALLMIAALALTASWAASTLSSRLGGPLLSLPWAAGVALLIEAAVLLLLGLRIRRIRDGDREVRMDRSWGAVTASLAQANAVVGSMLAGWHALLVIEQATLLPIRSQHGPLWLVAGMTMIGIVVSAVGWVVESFCRLPPDDPDDRHGSAGQTRPRPAQEGGMARNRHAGSHSQPSDTWRLPTDE